VSASTTSSRPVAAAKTTPPASTTKKVGYIYYKAKSGDTLWEIANRHGTTVAEIKKLNGPSKCNNLKAGTVLKLSSKG
jgi:LysM repeat protein